MASLNKILLIGNVGKDPEVKHFEDGRTMASFTLATTERYTDRNGERKENTEWHNIVLWGKQAETAERYVRKGTQLYVEGKSTTRSWTDRDGAKKYVGEVKADVFQLLGAKGDPVIAGARQLEDDRRRQGGQSAPAGYDGRASMEDPNDLPF